MVTMQYYKQAARDTSSTNRPAGGSLPNIEKVVEVPTAVKVTMSSA